MPSEKSSSSGPSPTRTDNHDQERQSGSDAQPYNEVPRSVQHSAPPRADLRALSPPATRKDDAEATHEGHDSSGPATPEPLPVALPPILKLDEKSMALALRVALILMESYIAAVNQPTPNAATPTHRLHELSTLRFSRYAQSPQRAGMRSTLFSDDPTVPLPHLFHSITPAPVSTRPLSLSPMASSSTTPPVLLLPPPPPITPTTGNPAPPSIINNIPLPDITQYLSSLPPINSPSLSSNFPFPLFPPALPPLPPSVGNVGAGYHTTFPNPGQQPVRRAERASWEYHLLMAERESIRRRAEKEEERRRLRSKSAGIFDGLIESILGGKGKRKRDDDDESGKQGRGGGPKKGKWLY